MISVNQNQLQCILRGDFLNTDQGLIISIALNCSAFLISELPTFCKNPFVERVSLSPRHGTLSNQTYTFQASYIRMHIFIIAFTCFIIKSYKAGSITQPAVEPILQFPGRVTLQPYGILYHMVELKHRNKKGRQIY